MKFGNNSKK